jgi:glycosyltransferase involved in cell wall biosynthesis
MKIAIWHNLPSGGGKRALYNYVHGLLERGHSLQAWCPPTADQSFLPLSNLIPEHIVPISWQSRKVAGGVISRGLALYHNENIPKKLKAMDQHCRLCADAINQGGFDLFFANPCMYFRTTSIGRFVKIPKLIYLQEPYRWLYEAMPTFPWAALPSSVKKLNRRFIKSYIKDWVKMKWWRLQAREEIISAQAYDTILVNSLFSRENILRSYGLDAKVCYLGIDTDVFVDLGLNREHMAIGIGAFVPEKNIHLVLEALALVKAPRPRLVWIGNVAQPDYLEDLKRLANAREVDFEPLTGIEDQKVVELLNRARLMVYTPRLEPFGFAPLEANACGTPVVAVAEGGVRETIINGMNGILAEHSPQSLSAAIQKVLSDHSYARQLGQNGYRAVHENWSMPSAIDRLEHRFVETLQAAS